jgi:hypothetical protein
MDTPRRSPVDRAISRQFTVSAIRRSRFRLNLRITLLTRPIPSVTECA